MCIPLFKGIFFLYLLGLSYHGPIDIEENIIIPLNYTSIPSATMAVIEFQLGDQIVRPCQISLGKRCESVSDGCLCTQTSSFTSLVNITYNRVHKFQTFRVVILDSENKRHVRAWQKFPKNKEPGLNDSDVNLPILADIKDCALGWFGADCSNRCSLNCRGDGACNATDGVCKFGCKDGYSGLMCDTACNKGSFGENCVNNCSMSCGADGSCSTVNGSCLHGCRDGYTGTLCNDVCPPRYYGPSCKLMCSEFCVVDKYQEPDVCHHVSGSCLLGCQDGYEGTLCTDEQYQRDVLLIGLSCGLVVAVVIIINGQTRKFFFTEITDDPEIVNKLLNKKLKLYDESGSEIEEDSQHKMTRKELT